MEGSAQYHDKTPVTQWLCSSSVSMKVPLAGRAGIQHGLRLRDTCDTLLVYWKSLKMAGDSLCAPHSAMPLSLVVRAALTD